MTQIHYSLTTLLCALLLLQQSHSSSHNAHRHNRFHRHNAEISNEVDIDERLALQHSERVAEAGACELPKLQVVHVSDHYPGRYYLPHCTLLHRCGKHAGCCGTDRLKCVAEKKEKVILHFYSVRIVGHGIPAERKVEKLTFTNHTKCGCAPADPAIKNDL